MGRANNLDCEVMPEDSDYAYDVRLARRWKRRCMTNNSFKKKSYSHTIKKALDDVEKREGMVEEDYVMYLKDFEQYNEDKSVEDDDTDPQYAMFFKQLREDGKSYVLDITIDDEMSMLIKYEEEDGLDNELKRKTSETWKNVSSGEKIGTPNDFRNLPGREKIETPETFRSVLSNERKRSVAEDNLKPELQNLVSRGTSGTNRRLSQKPAPKVHCSPNPESKNKTSYDRVDESYQMFLSCLKQDGNILVLTMEDGKQCRYEENCEGSSDSDSEIVATDSAPYCDEGKYTPFVTSKLFVSSVDVQDWQCNESPGRSNSSLFREKLMDILCMPYDHEEFEELMQEASDRKPLERSRDLRGRIISYTIDTVSKSYLDHYADLAKKIDSVQGDRRRVLNLLRGFFYWLKNLSQEGAFQPWRDGSCLKAMPKL